MNSLGHQLVAVMAVYLLMAIIYIVMSRLIGIPHFGDKPDFGPLDRRMQAYADLKKAEVSKEQPAAQSLDALAHEVLLGTLKKVEAKNTALATLWVFLITSMLLLATSGAVKDIWIVQPVMNCLIFISFPFLLVSISGMKQIDQIHSNRILAGTCCLSRVASLMQSELKLSLIRKELDFRFSYFGASSVVFFFFPFSVAAALNLIL